MTARANAPWLTAQGPPQPDRPVLLATRTGGNSALPLLDLSQTGRDRPSELQAGAQSSDMCSVAESDGRLSPFSTYLDPEAVERDGCSEHDGGAEEGN